MKILLITFTFLFCISCKTTTIATETDFYPKQCKDYKDMNKIREDFIKRNFNNPPSSLFKYAHEFSRNKKLIMSYRFEDQRAKQAITFYEMDSYNNSCSYTVRYDYDGPILPEEIVRDYGGVAVVGDCNLKKEMLQKLEKFFGDDSCQIDGIYTKSPDEDIMIVERLNSLKVLSFKYIYTKEEKEKLYSILSEIWGMNFAEDKKSVPWDFLKNKKVFPYDPLKKLRNEEEEKK